MNKILIIIFALFTLTGCKSQQQSIFDSEWKLLQIRGTDYSNENPPVTLTLNQAEAKASGFAGCNNYFGGYVTTHQQIKFSHIASTKMFCADKMKLEDSFLKSMEEVDEYSISRGRLQLQMKGEVILEFSK